jgi:hypothetical protein
VACSSSWKYSKEVPIASCNSSNWSCLKQRGTPQVKPSLRAHICGQDVAHPFIEQLLASILQAFPTLFNTSPLLQHTGNFGVDLVDSADQFVAHVEVLRHARQVLSEVRFLTMRYRAINQREPVVELLWGLDGLLWVKGMHRGCSCNCWWTRTWGGRT